MFKRLNIYQLYNNAASKLIYLFIFFSPLLSSLFYYYQILSLFFLQQKSIYFSSIFPSSSFAEQVDAHQKRMLKWRRQQPAVRSKRILKVHPSAP